MNRPRLTTLHLTGLLFLSLTSMLCDCPAHGQVTDVQIMVNGPWVYAQDPGDSSRVVLITALSENHGPAFVFPGGDADSQDARRSRSMALVPGKFSLKFAPSACGLSTPSSAKVLHVSVAADIIKKVIDDRKNYQAGIQRYTISLPKPCYYESHDTRRSRIGPESEDAMTEGHYTVWMVLHYRLPANSSAILSGDSDDARLSYGDALRFVSNASGAPALSLVISAPPSGSDLECDSHSLESFVKLNQLFGWKLRVQFPKLDERGKQTPDYSSNRACIGTASAHLVDFVKLSQQTLTQIERLKAYLADPSKPKAFDTNRTLDDIGKSLDELFDGKVPRGIQDELKHARERLAALQSTNELGQSSPKSVSLQAKECGECVFRETQGDLSVKSVGSADCATAQAGINGVVP